MKPSAVQSGKGGRRAQGASGKVAVGRAAPGAAAVDKSAPRAQLAPLVSAAALASTPRDTGNVWRAPVRSAWPKTARRRRQIRAQLVQARDGGEWQHRHVAHVVAVAAHRYQDGRVVACEAGQLHLAHGGAARGKGGHASEEETAGLAKHTCEYAKRNNSMCGATGAGTQSGVPFASFHPPHGLLGPNPKTPLA